MPSILKPGLYCQKGIDSYGPWIHSCSVYTIYWSPLESRVLHMNNGSAFTDSVTATVAVWTSSKYTWPQKLGVHGCLHRVYAYTSDSEIYIPQTQADTHRKCACNTGLTHIFCITVIHAISAFGTEETMLKHCGSHVGGEYLVGI